MNRATIAGVLEGDPVLSHAPTGEETVSMLVRVPRMSRGDDGVIAVRVTGEAAVLQADGVGQGSIVLVSGRLSHQTINAADGGKDQHYEVVGRAQELPGINDPQSMIASNQVAFTGRLTRDPELRTTPSGTSMCRIRIAVDGMGAAGIDSPGFIDVTEFGKQGEASARRLSKGWLVAVEGRLNHQTWETDGRPRQTHSVIGWVEHLSAPRASGDREQEVEREQAQTVDPREPGSASRTPRPGLPGRAASEQLAQVGGAIGDDIAF
jgi:single-strand DNA-binding protein